MKSLYRNTISVLILFILFTGIYVNNTNAATTTSPEHWRLLSAGFAIQMMNFLAFLLVIPGSTMLQDTLLFQQANGLVLLMISAEFVLFGLQPQMS